MGSYVEEYCATEYRNVNTGELVHGSFPEGMVNEVTYDKSVKAFASTLNNYCNVSVNKVRDFLKDISNWQICISTGKVSNLTKELSDKTTKERENIYNDLLNSPFMNADFTILRVNGKNLSTLIATTGNGALFDYTRTKGIDSLNNSIVAHYLHTLIHDLNYTELSIIQIKAGSISMPILEMLYKNMVLSNLCREKVIATITA